METFSSFYAVIPESGNRCALEDCSQGKSNTCSDYPYIWSYFSTWAHVIAVQVLTHDVACDAERRCNDGEDAIVQAYNGHFIEQENHFVNNYES